MSERTGDEPKTEQPTERRLAKARQEGVVPSAHGVAAAAVLLSGAAMISLGGGKLAQLLELCMMRGLSFKLDPLQDLAALIATMSLVVSPAVLVVVIFLAAMAAVGFAADILVGGWSFSVQPLLPDFGRLNPLRGLQQLVSRAALFEMAKSLAKLAGVGVISFCLMRSWAPGFLAAAVDTWPAGGRPRGSALDPNLFDPVGGARRDCGARSPLPTLVLSQPAQDDASGAKG